MINRSKSAVTRPAWCAILLSVVIGLASCTPRYVPRTLSSGSPSQKAAVADDENVSVAALAYSPTREKAAFKKDLHKNGQMAVEIRLDRSVEVAGEGHWLFRRHGVQIQFSNGIQRYALDPLKVYENNRINPMGAAVALTLLGGLAGGLVGGELAMEGERRSQQSVAEAALTSVTLSAATPVYNGFVFFDLDGTKGAKPAALLIEYEGDSGQRHQLRIPF